MSKIVLADKYCQLHRREQLYLWESGDHRRILGQVPVVKGE